MRYLDVTEVEEIKQLRSENRMIKDIAQKYGVCIATISKIVNGKSGARAPKKYRRYLRIPLEPEATKDIDFSRLPDNVFFEHVRECNFIG